jgi:hypothetical protein
MYTSAQPSSPVANLILGLPLAINHEAFSLDYIRSGVEFEAFVGDFR